MRARLWVLVALIVAPSRAFLSPAQYKARVCRSRFDHRRPAIITARRPSGDSPSYLADKQDGRDAVTPAKSLSQEQKVGRGALAAILGLLVLQNAGTSLLASAVRSTTPYDGASVALFQELAKIPLVFAVFLCSFGKVGSFKGVVCEACSWSALDLAVPSALFAMQVGRFRRSLDCVTRVTVWG